MESCKDRFRINGIIFTLWNLIMMKIDYQLPEGILSNEDLSALYPEWSAEKILAKTGISSRHVVGEGEDALSLAETACKKLLASGVDASTIDFVLFCTQSPRYRLPSSACILQDRLGIPVSAGALDFDLGCSGFVYGLSLAKGLVVGGMAKQVLLVTAETYTKYLGGDRSTRTIFGDGAAVTLVNQEVADAIGNFTFGTDGSGYDRLILKDGEVLHMDGPEIFNFTLEIVPKAIADICQKNGIDQKDVDLYVFHQANKFMLDAIRKVNFLPKDKFYINLEDTGNTVSSTIPIALKRATDDGVLKKGMNVMILGFGVGLSWAGTLVKW